MAAGAHPNSSSDRKRWEGAAAGLGVEAESVDLDHGVQMFRLGSPVQLSLAIGMKVQRAMTPLAHSRK